MLATSGSNHSNEPWDGLLGYLNFSSGAHDPQFFEGLNQAFSVASRDDVASPLSFAGPAGMATDGCWRAVVDQMGVQLARLQRERESFADSQQAQRILSATRRLVPEYLAFHRDLLFHQTADDIFNSFMLGRVVECLLQRHPWDDEPSAVQQAIHQLNDYIGYRPIPVLEAQRIEPRPHEKVRPVPWYVADVGVAVGKYAELISGAMEILRQTDPELCERSWFHMAHLDELAVDPRAYDFDHPVNKRPNYHFGEWDPHVIDQRGHYRRFVVREVTLRALLQRVQDAPRLRQPREELVWEASAVLAGTILMSSAITGDGPEAHDSSMTLSKLIPLIAACRDDFYDRLLQGVEGPRGERLRREAKSLHQSFGGARQYLNTHLSLQRARQLEHARLARVFSRMGYLNAAQRQADVVHVPSARIVCRIDCRLTACHHALRDGRHADVMEHLDQVLDLLRRGIDCGALVDPWNIIGFNAQFSLFPAMENSVFDHRVDDLLRVMDEIFDVLARLWSSASAADDQSILPAVAARYDETAQWWNQFAAHEVQAVETVPPLEGLRAARDVSHALGEWHRAGAVAGDVAFWAPHVQSLESPKPYALIVETLLSRNDYVSSQSVLVHWLSRSATLPLESRGASFHDLTAEWVQQIASLILSGETIAAPQTQRSPGELLCKFFDYLEANADPLWEVPEFELHPSRAAETMRDEEPFAGEAEDSEEEDNLFQAAYENVVFQDSTDDGIEADIVDRDFGDDDVLEEEVTNCQPRLLFLHTLARIWRIAAMALARAAVSPESGGHRARFLSAITMWHERCAENRRELLRLMNQIQSARLARHGHDVDAMARYDRQRWLKESLLEQAILTSVKMASAELVLRAARAAIAGEPIALEKPARFGNEVDAMTAELEFAAGIITAAIRRDRAAAEQLSAALIEFLPTEEILYAPLGRGGSPRKMTEVRIRQQYIQDVLIALPRLGLVRQTLELIDTIREMEKNVPQGHGAVTQYDDMFEVGFVELVNVLVRSSGSRQNATGDQDADTVLISCLEQLAESALSSWLQHSQTLRLSVLERVRSGPEWKRLVEFIEKYGDDIFSQEFLHLGNVRAILHFGTENWVRELSEDPSQETHFRLISALGRDITWDEAARRLTLILEAVSENYDEYRDYNSTTTRSDRGSNLYVLLDFLRLRADYDRIAWNLRPVILAHRALVRSRRSEAAQLWRRLLHERLGAEADSYQRKLIRLQRKYAVRLGTVSQRIGERFLQPMTIDRMQSLVESAMQQLRDGTTTHAFEILEEEAELFMRESQNGGISVPKWLAALEEEVDRLDTSDLFKVHESTRDDELLLEPIEVQLHDLQVQLTDTDEDRE